MHVTTGTQQFFRHEQLSYSFKHQFSRNLDRRLQRSVDRAFVREEAVNALGGLAMRRIRAQPKLDVDAPDDEYVLLGLDLADSFGDQASVARWNLTRIQRASESPAQSTSSAGYDVVECRGARRIGIRWNLVMLSDSAVHSESDRLRLTRQPGFSNRSLYALDANLRSVHNFGHSD